MSTGDSLDPSVAVCSDRWLGGGAGRYPAEAVERQDGRDAIEERFLAGDAVGAGCAFLESQDLVGHRGGEFLTPASPGRRLVVEQQHRPGGVALETAGLACGSRWSTTRS